MFDAPQIDESLLSRLPLPLAQVFRRAINAKNPLEQHLEALYLAEVGLKLLASAAVVEYAALSQCDPRLEECLKNLARPTLGHWWEIGRRLTPLLADAGCAGYDSLRQLLLGRSRDDMPRTAGLDAVLREILGTGRGARTTVRLSELFDRLVTLRNKGPGHGAPAAHPEQFHARLGAALLSGLAEVYGRLDVLAGRRLVYVSDVRQSGGVWLVQWLELAGANARRLTSVELARHDFAHVPDGQRVYLRRSAETDGLLLPVYPLILFEPDSEEVLLLNGRQGRQQAEWLCYTSGRELRDQAELHSQHQELLAKLLRIEVTPRQVEGWAEQSRADDSPDEPTPPAESTLGEFELLSELGRGGMGVVYRAWQPSLGRQVALKELSRTKDANKSEQRFIREIRALGRVDHPNLVKIYASGSDGNRWFYAMELVEGTPLSSVWDRLQGSSAGLDQLNFDTWHNAVSTAYSNARRSERPLSSPTTKGSSAGSPNGSDSVSTTEVVPTDPYHVPAGMGAARRADNGSRALRAANDYVVEVVELVRQAAQAAQALHQANVVHRDIKPDNIMLWADGRQAVLMDLGLAQFLDDDEARLTCTRQFVGTLRYASPEQILAVEGLDPRSDVYSLGATLWELLTLRPMFGATKETPTPEVMRRIQWDEPERPSKHNSGVSRDLEAVVLHCLEKRPEGRYQTARELADELARVLAGEPVVARPVGEMERLRRWCGRNRLVTGLFAAAVLAVLLGLAGVTWKWRAAVVAEGRAVQAAKENAMLAINNASLAKRADEQNKLLLDTMTRVLASSIELGDTQRMLGKRDGARRSYQAGAKIGEQLVQADPTNADIARNLSSVRKKLAELDDQPDFGLVAADSSKPKPGVTPPLPVIAAKDDAQGTNPVDRAMLAERAPDYRRSSQTSDTAVVKESVEPSAAAANHDSTVVPPRVELIVTPRDKPPEVPASGGAHGVSSMLRELPQKPGQLAAISALPTYRDSREFFRWRMRLGNAVPLAIDDLNFALLQHDQDKELAGELLVIRGLVLARRGQLTAAAQTAERLTTLEVNDAGNLWWAAEVYAVCVTDNRLPKTTPELSSEQLAIKEQYAVHAVKLLQETQAVGYFRDPDNLIALQQEQNFDVLRNRDDFKKLLSAVSATQK